MLRDHELKNAVGKIEDDLAELERRITKIADEASNEGAQAHGTFYDNVVAMLIEAKDNLIAAYSYLLNGDEDLGVEPLEDE